MLTRRQDFEIIITGSGVVRHKDGGITGVATLDMIEQFRVDYAIVGALRADRTASLMDYDYREVRGAGDDENARQRYLAVDSSKFGRNAMMKLCHISEVNDVSHRRRPATSWRRFWPIKMRPHVRAQASRFAGRVKSSEQTPCHNALPGMLSGALCCGRCFMPAGDTLSATTTPPPCALACCTAAAASASRCAIRRRRG